MRNRILPAGALTVTVSLAGLYAAQESGSAVVVRFEVGATDTAPFPTDLFTVADARHVTGRRLAYPYPDCVARPSDCADLDVINTLDGWGLQTRLSIPFTGRVDLSTVSSDSVFVVPVEGGRGRPAVRPRIGINQVVWDEATSTLHVEVDRLLDQQRRYAAIVTTEIRDLEGRKVHKAEAFERFDDTVPAWYAAHLREALAAAHAAGVPPGHVAAASVFTTQTITSVMERIAADIRASVPAPADFLLGPAGERAVFDRSDVSGIHLRQQTRVNPLTFAPPMPVNLAQLDAVPGAVGRIAYGRYRSPDYLVQPDQYIPAVGTRHETPPVQRHTDVYFTLYLPAGPPPPGGWPVVLIGGGVSGNQHVSTTIFASVFASHGLATLGISHAGQGFGPGGRLTITRTDGTTIDLPNAGRGADQNGDGVYGNLEGVEAASPRTWTISLRDTHRQTVIDYLQLVRVIRAGMDVDGDLVPDIDASRLHFQGASAGPLFGASFVALEPNVSAAAFLTPPGLIPEHARWQPGRRVVMGFALQARVPTLLNAPGLMMLEGVPVSPPHFDENKPLRDQPPVVNTTEGAMAIQQALEIAEMAAEAGIGPVPWAKHLRLEPLPGRAPRAVLIQFAIGDQNAVNAGTSAIIREGGLADQTTVYRHDLALAAHPTLLKNPHLFAGQIASPNLTARAIARGIQEQTAMFLASGGTTIIHPSPGQWFEVPVAGPLPEGLGFIP